MKKYLALAVLGMMLVLVQPALAQCGCPVSVNPCPCPIAQPACPVCPTCPPRLVYQPMLQQVQPVIQTVVEPVMSYRYRQVATCPCDPCNPCNPCGTTGAAAPYYGPQTILYQGDDGFWSDFFGFD